MTININNFSNKIPFNVSSISAYCFLMIFYSFFHIGITKIFWIYSSIIILCSVFQWYSIFVSKNDNKEYTFFTFNNFAVALFLLTIYFDAKYKFINFNLNSLSTYFLITSLVLILPHLFRKKK